VRDMQRKPPMPTLQRRALLRATSATCAALALGGMVGPLRAQNKLAAKLNIVIPAASRSSLDLFGRALGDALVGTGLTDEIGYENKDEKGGVAALAYFNENFANDPNAFFVADTSLAGALAVQKSALNLALLQPVARLASDAMVVAVAGASPLKTIADLTERLRSAQKSTPIALGAPGSVEHVLSGRLQKTGNGKPEDGVYQHFVRSFEMLDAVLGGRAVAGIASYSIFHEELASGKLRALGIASVRGAQSIRSLREQGLDLEASNVRTVFTGKGVPAARQTRMVESVRNAAAYELWKKSLRQSFWDTSWLAGPDLALSIDLEMKTAQLMVQLLRLKA
jgi:putative tricarboxylic transport membrane protein